jgi:hypothetical protein
MRQLFLTLITLICLIGTNTKAGDVMSAFDENYIHHMIESANYCKTKDDCMIASFGCPFGCGTYTNKKEEPGLQKLVQHYLQNTKERCIYDCIGPSAKPDCVNGRCVESVCAIGKTYNRENSCNCPNGTIQTGYSNTESTCIYPNQIFEHMSKLDPQHSAENFKTITQQIADAFPKDPYRPVVIEDFARDLTGEWQSRRPTVSVGKNQVENAGLKCSAIEEKMLQNGWGKKSEQWGVCFDLNEGWASRATQMAQVFGPDVEKIKFVLQRSQTPNESLYNFLSKFKDSLATAPKIDRLNQAMAVFLLFDTSSPLGGKP